jgi:hypothetical protein
MQVKSSAKLSELPVLYTTADLPCLVPNAAHSWYGMLEPSLTTYEHLRRSVAFTGA